MTYAPRRYCHEMVKETAQEMAGAAFEVLASDNTRWAKMKTMCPELSAADTQKVFVGKLWPHLIEQARTTLAKMLTGPLPDLVKDQIHEALVLDNELRFEKQPKSRRVAAHLN